MADAKDRSTEPGAVEDDDVAGATVITDRSLISWPSPSEDDGRCDILTVARGPETGRIHELEGSVVGLGRAPTSSIRVEDDGVSRVHARLARQQDGRWVLDDAGSSNGTFVGGSRIRRHVLEEGDVIQLGPRARFRFDRVPKSQIRMMRKLYESSVEDALTGVANRRLLEERLRAETSFGVRHGTDLAILMIDVDHFKRVNDTYGHDAGDVVLKQLTRAVREQIRVEDFFARYGGEEFVVLAPGIEAKGAAVLGERLRSVVERMTIVASEEKIRVTVSVGIAMLASHGRPAAPAGLIKAADENLYRAKRGGRNRVVGP